MDQVLLSSADISPNGKLKQSGVLFSASTPAPEVALAHTYAVEDAKALKQLRRELQEMVGSR